MATQKEYRKPYILTEGGYQEMMATTWDKSVWNQILEVDPIWAEYLFTRAELPDAATAAEIRYLRYIKQSEFKKMYSGNDYVDEEYIWKGVLPTVDPWDPKWDFNWRPTEGGGVWPPDTITTISICDADTDGCYCEGKNANVTFTSTLPMLGIEFISGMGETVAAYTGQGTNEMTATISTPAGRVGQMRINVIMYDPVTKRNCASSVNIYQCADESQCCNCDDFAWDWDNSDDTIGAVPGSASVYVTGGTPPYSWSISAEDAEWSLSYSKTTGVANTVNATAAACGGADITVTDSCGCVATGSVRYTGSGSWGRICNGSTTVGCCVITGTPDSWTTSGAQKYAFKYQGKYYQRNGYYITEGSLKLFCSAGTYAENFALCQAQRGNWVSHCDGQCDDHCVATYYNPCTECLTLEAIVGKTVADYGYPWEVQHPNTIVEEYCYPVASPCARFRWYCYCTNYLDHYRWNC